ncbi:hypothetical protein BC826DRAFT_1112811 [Russula brevipes]|nr:hypothetical protein BC826DRAFT_1112811 [Russula brevipes]
MPPPTTRPPMHPPTTSYDNSDSCDDGPLRHAARAPLPRRLPCHHNPPVTTTWPGTVMIKVVFVVHGDIACGPAPSPQAPDIPGDETASSLGGFLKTTAPLRARLKSRPNPPRAARPSPSPGAARAAPLPPGAARPSPLPGAVATSSIMVVDAHSPSSPSQTLADLHLSPDGDSPPIIVPPQTPLQEELNRHEQQIAQLTAQNEDLLSMVEALQGVVLSSNVEAERAARKLDAM